MSFLSILFSLPQMRSVSLAFRAGLPQRRRFTTDPEPPHIGEIRKILREETTHSQAVIDAEIEYHFEKPRLPGDFYSQLPPRQVVDHILARLSAKLVARPTGAPESLYLQTEVCGRFGTPFGCALDPRLCPLLLCLHPGTHGEHGSPRSEILPYHP
jgi:hypothetical protein